MKNSDTNFRLGIDIGKETVKSVLFDGVNIIDTQIWQNSGQPLVNVKKILETVSKKFQLSEIVCGITGSGMNITNDFETDRIFETEAWIETVNRYYPDISGIIDIGETHKYLKLKKDLSNQKLIMDTYEAGDKCAAGSGKLCLKMASRLNFIDITEFSKEALKAENPVKLAIKCGAFIESDVIGAVNGNSRKKDDAAAGIFISICERFAKNKSIFGKIAFIGGTSDLPAMIHFLSKELGSKAELFVPEYNRVFSAIGAALLAKRSINIENTISELNKKLKEPFEYESWPQLKLEKSIIMSEPEKTKLPKILKSVGLGLDTGSFSTKCVAIAFDENGNLVVIGKCYVPTGGDPASAIKFVIKNVASQIKEQGYEAEEIVAGTTGSGRYFTGNLIGANLIKNEITTQAWTTRYYAKRFGIDIQYIAEIGGQDSKGIDDDSGETILNKLCAAGTGGNLSSLAEDQKVKIEDFGDLALQGTKPPKINSNCTVFINSAIDNFKMNNVSTPNLLAAACYAVANNYIQKVAGPGIIGKRVAFQGATAKNKGLIAAFEALLGQGVFIPPLPEFTGAIGAACMAYEMNPDASKFRGFEKIDADPCERKSKECGNRECSDHCTITAFNIDGKNYYYGDRCEIHSGGQRENLGKHLPNLVNEYQKMLFEACQIKVPEDAPKVGCPMIGLNWDYLPLFQGFFASLGLDLVPSGPNSRKTVELGISKTVNNMCLPVETAIGSVSVTAEKFEKIFIPRIISADQPDEKLRLSQTCPYWQGAPDMIPAILGIDPKRILSPILHLKHGKKHIRNMFIRFGKEKLGKTAKESGKAFDYGWKILMEFRQKLVKRGQEVLEQYKDEKVCFIAGRSYSLFDAEVSIKALVTVQQFGVLAFPQQFLPLDSIDISDSYPDLYSYQGQKKLKLGRMVRKFFNLNKFTIINIEYFGCAPDSFLVTWLSEEFGRKILKISIDAPTSLANLLTRIEAHLDWMDREKIEVSDTVIRTSDTPIEELGDRILWIPNMYRGAEILAAGLKEYGYNAKALPKSPDPTLSLARQANPNDICLPSLMLTEDMLYRIKQPDFDPDKEAFLRIASEGPCRLWAYLAIDRKILDKLGYRQVPLITLGSKSSHGGLSMMASILTWDMLVAHDLLQKMLLKTRPYEIYEGESQKLFDCLIIELVGQIPKMKKLMNKVTVKATCLLFPTHLKILKEFLKKASDEFSVIEISKTKKPHICVIGEFYVRGDQQANDNVIANLESFGAEVSLAPSTEFLSYSVAISKFLSKNRLKEIEISKKECKQFVAQWANTKIVTRDEHELFTASLPFLQGYHEMSPEELIQKGSKIINPNFGGEVICSMGKYIDSIEREYEGIVMVGPFNCVPSMITESILKSIGKELSDMPILTAFYDGFPDNSRDQALAQFMCVVKNRFEQKNKLLEV